MLCGDLERWDLGREVPGGGGMCILVADSTVVR